MVVSTKFDFEKILHESDLPTAEPYESGYLRSKGIMKQTSFHLEITVPYEEGR